MHISRGFAWESFSLELPLIHKKFSQFRFVLLGFLVYFLIFHILVDFWYKNKKTIMICFLRSCRTKHFQTNAKSPLVINLLQRTESACKSSFFAGNKWCHIKIVTICRRSIITSFLGYIHIYKLLTGVSRFTGLALIKLPWFLLLAYI